MRKSVLIVDDSEMVRKVMRDLLEKQTDWEIEGEAGDGVEAIEKARTLKPDLILLDYSMPRMNGIEAASVLRRMLPDVCIVAFTMFDESLGSRLSSAFGVDLVVPKPDGLTNLVKSVEGFMESKRLTKNGVDASRHEPGAPK